MLKHIVLFSLQGFENEEEKRQHLNKIKKHLEDLVSEIVELHSLKVHLNENPNETYDFLLEAEVENFQDLDGYALHPLHQKVVKELIAPYKKERACVDFTM